MISPELLINISNRCRYDSLPMKAATSGSQYRTIETEDHGSFRKGLSEESVTQLGSAEYHDKQR